METYGLAVAGMAKGCDEVLGSRHIYRLQWGGGEGGVYRLVSSRRPVHM